MESPPLSEGERPVDSQVTAPPKEMCPSRILELIQFSLLFSKTHSCLHYRNFPNMQLYLKEHPHTQYQSWLGGEVLLLVTVLGAAELALSCNRALLVVVPHLCNLLPGGMCLSPSWLVFRRKVNTFPFTWASHGWKRLFLVSLRLSGYAIVFRRS